MNKFISLVVILFLFIGLALWSPWLYIKFDIAQLFGVYPPDNIAGLQVYSLAGEIEVYIDGELKGTSSADKSPFVLDRVTPGNYLITLKRRTSVRGAYWDFNKLVTFVPGTSVIISYNLGPEEEFSEGHIIYATTKENSSNISQLTIETNINDPEVNVEESFIQKLNPQLYVGDINFDKQRKVTVQKPGYDSLELVILPDSQEEREALSKFNLNIEIHLMMQPVVVE